MPIKFAWDRQRVKLNFVFIMQLLTFSLLEENFSDLGQLGVFQVNYEQHKTSVGYCAMEINSVSFYSKVVDRKIERNDWKCRAAI